ncbi:MAG: hypothetical protein FWE59_06020, partial [Oscillospiraceae bacterium]|nr:hypothetical protein [Oscillospiraceae bacterium]
AKKAIRCRCTWKNRRNLPGASGMPRPTEDAGGVAGGDPPVILRAVAGSMPPSGGGRAGGRMPPLRVTRAASRAETRAVA